MPNRSAPSPAVLLPCCTLPCSKLGLDRQRPRLHPQTKAELAMHLPILQKPGPRPLATESCGSFREAVRLGPVSLVTLPCHAFHTPVPLAALGYR